MDNKESSVTPETSAFHQKQSNIIQYFRIGYAC